MRYKQGERYLKTFRLLQVCILWNRRGISQQTSVWWKRKGNEKGKGKWKGKEKKRKEKKRKEMKRKEKKRKEKKRKKNIGKIQNFRTSSRNRDNKKSITLFHCLVFSWSYFICCYCYLISSVILINWSIDDWLSVRMFMWPNNKYKTLSKKGQQTLVVRCWYTKLH